MSRIWTPPSSLDHAAVPTPRAPILERDRVKGYVANDERKPNRYFYLLHKEDDSVWECDGYRSGPADQPDDSPLVHWAILLFCPKCKQNLKLDSTRKSLKVYRECGLETNDPIRCPWPGDFGTPCTFAVVLEPPRKREDRIVTLNGGFKRQIDAVARMVR